MCVWRRRGGIFFWIPIPCLVCVQNKPKRRPKKRSDTIWLWHEGKKGGGFVVGLLAPLLVSSILSTTTTTLTLEENKAKMDSGPFKNPKEIYETTRNFLSFFSCFLTQFLKLILLLYWEGFKEMYNNMG